MRVPKIGKANTYDDAMIFNFFSVLHWSFWMRAKILSDFCRFGASSSSMSQSFCWMAVLASCAVPKLVANSVVEFD